MALTTNQRRNVAAMDAASKEELDAYAMANFGVSWDSADFLARLGARLTRHESISDKDRDTIASIYPHVPAKKIDEIVRFVNAQPAGPNRLYSYTAHLSGDTGEMRERLERVVSSYATHEVSQGILDKRSAASRGPDGKPERPPVERKVSPLDTRELLKKQFEGKKREAAEIIQTDPNARELFKEHLANQAETATEILATPSAFSLRDSIAAATEFHNVESVAADEGFIEPKDEA
jgi:hypothetical protein